MSEPKDQATGTPSACHCSTGSCGCPEMIRMLTEENKRLRKAGADLSVAALRVATEYDGVHRLMLAVSGWAKAMADEHGRGQ